MMNFAPDYSIIREYPNLSQDIKIDGRKFEFKALEKFMPKV